LIPKYVRRYTSSYLRWPQEKLAYELHHRDTALNILGFIPLGFFLHGLLRNKFGLSGLLSAVALTVGFMTSLVFESVQYVMISRDSSTLDLINNTIGTVIGIFIDRSYIRHVQHYWMRQTQQ
jgi:glycopeptide antibiotics resistance protein